MDSFENDEILGLPVAFSDRLSISGSDVSSTFSVASSGDPGPEYSRVHPSLVDYAGVSTHAHFSPRSPRGDRQDSGQFHVSPGRWAREQAGIARTPRWTSGFKGRTALRSSRVDEKSPPSAWSGGNKSPRALASRAAKLPDPPLLLTGDGIRRACSSGPAEVRGRSKILQRSRTKPDMSTNARVSKKTFTHGKHCDACAVEYMKHMKKPSVWEQNRRSNMIIAEILDRKKPPASIKAFYEPLQLLPDKKGTLQENLMISRLDSSTFMKDYRMANEPARMHTVCLPKKGQIKLTSMAYELNNPDYYDDRKKMVAQRNLEQHQELLYGSALPVPSSDAYRGQLIRNKSIIKQIRQGEKILSELQAQQNDGREKIQGQILETLVGGILSFEIPDAPHLNTTLQRFISGGSQYNSPRLQRDQINIGSLVTDSDDLMQSNGPRETAHETSDKSIPSPGFPALSLKYYKPQENKETLLKLF